MDDQQRAPEPAIEADEPKVIGQIIIDIKADLSLQVTTTGVTGPPALWATIGLLDVMARRQFMEQMGPPQIRPPTLVAASELPKGRPS